LLSFSHFFLWDILKVIKTLATLNHPFQQAKETTAYVHVMLINIYDKKNCIFLAFLQFFAPPCSTCIAQNRNITAI